MAVPEYSTWQTYRCPRRRNDQGLGKAGLSGQWPVREEHLTPTGRKPDAGREIKQKLVAGGGAGTGTSECPHGARVEKTPRSADEEFCEKVGGGEDLPRLSCTPEPRCEAEAETPSRETSRGRAEVLVPADPAPAPHPEPRSRGRRRWKRDPPPGGIHAGAARAPSPEVTKRDPRCREQSLSWAGPRGPGRHGRPADAPWASPRRPGGRHLPHGTGPRGAGGGVRDARRPPLLSPPARRRREAKAEGARAGMGVHAAHRAPSGCGIIAQVKSGRMREGKKTSSKNKTRLLRKRRG